MFIICYNYNINNKLIKNMTFEKINNNPKNKNTGDCVIRSISYITGKSWDTIYLSLTEIGFEMKLMPNDKKVFDEYLKNEGFTKMKMPKREATRVDVKFGVKTIVPTFRRFTLEEFIDENPKMKAIVSVANHLTAIDSGKLIDIWNCSHKSVGNYWIK